MKEFCYDGVLEKQTVDSIIARAKIMGFKEDELPDVVQQVAIVLLGFRYDAANTYGAKERTVLQSVIDRQLCKIRRWQQRDKKRNQKIMATRPESYDAGIELSEDVREIIDALSPRRKQICELLIANYDRAEIAAKLNCTWLVVDREIKRLGKYFRSIGLGEWIGEQSNE